MKETERALPACRACGASTRHELSVPGPGVHRAREFAYRRCADCGALQIQTLPPDLDRFYGDDYYTQSSRRYPTRSNPWRRSWSRLRLGESRLIRLLSGRRYARFDWFRKTGVGLEDPILDIGCGDGRLLCRMARDGFASLVGIDAQTRDVSGPSPGLRIEQDRAETHEGQYRLVMAHHSFEHMEDPVRAMSAFARLVAPGGRLLLRVPLAEGWAFEHYGRDWAQLDPPRHLFLPTRRSIERLAASSGFRVVEIVDDSGPFQILGSERIREERRGGAERGSSVLASARRPRWLRALEARLRARRLRREGRGDQACFYLERDDRSRSTATAT